MKTITDHVVAGDAAPQLTITVLDEPGAGGANHEYRISSTYKKSEKMPIPMRSRMDDQTIIIDADGSTTLTLERILFQNGPIPEVGVNGITQEALLAIVIDRLRCFQAGPYPHSLNEQALDCAVGALRCLQARTKERIQRGVEGENKS